MTKVFINKILNIGIGIITRQPQETLHRLHQHGGESCTDLRQTRDPDSWTQSQDQFRVYKNSNTKDTGERSRRSPL